MPTYESRCPVCGRAFEYHRSISERNDVPVCCSRPTERVVLTPPMGFVNGPAAGWSSKNAG